MMPSVPIIATLGRLFILKFVAVFTPFAEISVKQKLKTPLFNNPLFFTHFFAEKKSY